jgi:hypothetical protein
MFTWLGNRGPGRSGRATRRRIDMTRLVQWSIPVVRSRWWPGRSGSGRCRQEQLLGRWVAVEWAHDDDPPPAESASLTHVRGLPTGASCSGCGGAIDVVTGELKQARLPAAGENNRTWIRELPGPVAVTYGRAYRIRALEGVERIRSRCVVASPSRLPGELFSLPAAESTRHRPPVAHPWCRRAGSQRGRRRPSSSTRPRRG